MSEVCYCINRKIGILENKLSLGAPFRILIPFNITFLLFRCRMTIADTLPLVRLAFMSTAN